MDSKKTKIVNTAFSLLELIAIAAMVSIIAAFAIPNYTRYITETKVNSMWAQAEAAKLAVQSEYYKKYTALGSITANSGTADYTTTNADYVKCITIQGGTVSVVGNSNDFSGKNIWISWTPSLSNDELTWSCSYSSDAAEYVTEHCSLDSCSEFGAWGTATQVGSSQDIWYFGSLSAAEVSAAFSASCTNFSLWNACSACFDFVNTDTEQRYMDFSLATQTHNYVGSLGSDPDWSGQTSWTYDYEFTVVTQKCMSQTRTESTCDPVPAASYTSDASCT